MRFDYILYYIVAFLDVARAVVSARFNSPSVIDLMQHVAGNTSGQAMKRIPGSNGHSTAHNFQGSSRHIEVTHRTVARVRHLLEDSEEFTLVTAIKQQEKTSGSILSFTAHDTRYFELESSGRRDELRLHYFHSGRLRTETFPYKLADNQWHTVALGFSRDYIEVFIDCKKVYERSIGWLEWNWSRRMSIFIGQRGATHAYFKGAIEYIALIGEPNGVLHICPHANIACPTCSQFRQLQHSIEKLYEHIKALNDKLLMAEHRITELEQCECQLSCIVNGTHHKNEDVWHPNVCTTCICKNGTVDCQTESCPVADCKFPVSIPGTCCPQCRKTCFKNGIHYDDGETYSVQPSSSPCVQCICQDGSVHCDEQNCDPPSCPEEDQIQDPGKCCRMCKGTDFCGRGHECHPNATCVPFTTKYTCACNEGFSGDGKHCEDIDECQREGGDNGHFCSGGHVRCVNTIGSYECVCELGFIATSPYTCGEHDECATNSHNCDINARCTNVEGEYKCACNDGYEGNGVTCRVRCREECRNGGVCVSPDVCQCRKGFIGRSCREELDECQLQMDQCHPNSECVNVPGSYYCQCKQGFYSNSADNRNGAECIDLNECAGWGGGHNCPEGTLCRNTPGGYECACISPTLCGGCIDGDQWHMNGSSWSPKNSSCITLSCIDGLIRSSRVECDCRNPQVDRKCCTECREEGQCEHHGKVYLHGHQWVDQCHQCQCLVGEIDCWSIDCPRLSCKTVVLEGDCCPSCEEDRDPCHVLDEDPRGIIREMTESCDFDRRTYSSGRTWTLASDQCTTCECKGGHVCCQYRQNCRRGRKNGRKRLRELNSRPHHRNSRNRNSDRSQRNHRGRG